MADAADAGGAVAGLTVAAGLFCGILGNQQRASRDNDQEKTGQNGFGISKVTYHWELLGLLPW